MQLLLIRHALPLRSEPGQGSDPELADEGYQQAARLPDALRRFPVTKVVSSPQRRSIQTATPLAQARGLDIEIDDRFAEYDRDMSSYVPIELVRTERPDDWARMSAGQLPEGVDADEFMARIGEGVADIVESNDHDDTVAVFSHGGVINVLLHGAGDAAPAVVSDRLRIGHPVARHATRRDLRRRGERHGACLGFTAEKPTLRLYRSDESRRIGPRRAGPPPRRHRGAARGRTAC